MNIHDIIQECDVGCIQLTENDNRCDELNKLLDSTFGSYKHHVVIELFKNAIRTYNGLSSSVIGWEEFIKDKLVPILKIVKSKLPEINPNDKSEDPFIQPPFDNEEDLDAACELGDLQLDDWIKEAKDAGYKNLVCIAPTGKGKSKKLSKWLAHTDDELQSGIILTHSNRAASEIYDQVIALNPNKADSIKIFNWEQDDYKLLKSNPELLNQYNWVICYNQRLIDSDVDVLFTLIKDLDYRRRLRNSSRTYIISDESIMSAKAEVISRADINRIDVMSNNAFSRYIENPSESNRMMIEKFYKQLETKIYEVSSASDLSDEELILLKSFTGLNVKNSSIYQLRVYMARFSTLLNYIVNRYDEFLAKYKDPKRNTIQYIVNIKDISSNHEIIVFDATGDINFGNNNKLFYKKQLAGVTKNIIDFHHIKINVPPRKSSIKDYDKFFDDLKSRNFKFNDNSIILWYCDAWYTDKKEILSGRHDLNIIPRMQKYLKDTGSKDCMVCYFNGAEIKGDNRFRKCTSIYVLSNYDSLNKNAIWSARAITGNNEYEMTDKFVGDVQQCTGRTIYRSYKSNTNFDGLEAPVHFYFSEDIPAILMARIINYYGTKSERFLFNKEDKDQLNVWVNIAIELYRLDNPDKRLHDGKLRTQLNYIIENNFNLSLLDMSSKFNTNDPKKLFNKAFNILSYLGIVPSITKMARGRK